MMNTKWSSNVIYLIYSTVLLVLRRVQLLSQYHGSTAKSCALGNIEARAFNFCMPTLPSMQTVVTLGATTLSLIKLLIKCKSCREKYILSKVDLWFTMLGSWQNPKKRKQGGELVGVLKVKCCVQLLPSSFMLF